MNSKQLPVALSLSACLILLFSTFVYCQPTPASHTIDEFLRNKMRERRITGLQLAVVHHGNIVLLKSFGLANIQDSLPVTNRSIFPQIFYVFHNNRRKSS